MMKIMNAAARPDLEIRARYPGEAPPGKVFNLHLPGAKICLPDEIEKSLVPGDQGGKAKVLAIVAPRYTFTGLHWDDGAGWSTIKGGTKLWAIWPPTDENRGVLEDEFAQEDDPKLASAMSLMKGGIFVVQRPNQSLWLPPFCPHAVLTIQSGISWGIDVYEVGKAAQRVHWLKVLALLSESLENRPSAAVETLRQQMAETLALGKTEEGRELAKGRVGRGPAFIVHFLDEWAKARQPLGTFWGWLERKDRRVLETIKGIVLQMVEVAHEQQPCRCAECLNPRRKVQPGSAEAYWQAHLQPRSTDQN